MVAAPSFDVEAAMESLTKIVRIEIDAAAVVVSATLALV